MRAPHAVSAQPIDSVTPSSRPAVSGVQSIRCVFQPIVDLLTGSPVGYEVLARGDESGAADKLFADARENGTPWELEKTCRHAALRRIAELRSKNPNALFFLNVSPAVLE